ncbi:MAG: hypothetical protein M3Y56_06010 [Armatimonadota bacterium]|nr:hypothetical protein [Armatimonadota bacterium]
MAAKKILLVEGPDDKHVMMHLCGNRELILDKIDDLGGVDELLEDFPVRLKESEIESLGVIIDADSDLTGRWRGLQDRLTNAGYLTVPDDPTPTGTIVLPPPRTLLPRAGVWIMPNNQATGMLEDFLRFLVPQESLLFKHVQSSVTMIPEGERRFSELTEPKAIIHTWLAWQEEPGRPYGTAIKAKYLDLNVPEVDVLVTWLVELFFPQ